MGLYILAILFVLVCLLMMGVILIQKPRGGGLSGAFGGAGGSAQSPFGAKTGDFLTWFTVSCFVLFILLAITLVYSTRPTKPAEAGANTVTSPTTAPAPRTELPPLPPVEDTPAEAPPAIPEAEMPTTPGNSGTQPATETLP
jgi:preprotein translocase subunit SecG